MPIPIGIEKLLGPQAVESAKVEYKAGWNPTAVLHTVCAFANDIDNWGGGYIVIGVAEEDGRPKLPPAGVDPAEADKLQKELLALCKRLTPSYMPVCEPVEHDGALLIAIWAPGGYDRPYTAPIDPHAKKSPRAYYARRFSNTVKANAAEEEDLHDMSGYVPFDDRVNHGASVGDLSRPYMEDFLREVDSSLVDDLDTRQTEALALDMRIARSVAGTTSPLNVGLMMFNSDPERFFPYSRIEVVDMPDPTGTGMTERVFHGAIDRQLDDALAYIRNYAIAERVFKHPDRAEATRVFNWPYAAVEEALTNAVLHRSYAIHEPVTVRIEPDCMRILSLPGPDRSISDADLEARHLVSKRYRNRRIGEFLKELGLAEGRNTGIPTMLRACAENGSEPPSFETDGERTYFEVVLPINAAFAVKPDDVTEQSAAAPVRRTREQLAEGVLAQLANYDRSLNEIAHNLGYKSASKALRETVEALIERGIVERSGQSRGASAKLHLSR